MYPPFTKIIRILMTSEDENLAKDITKTYYEKVKILQQKYKGQFVYLGVMKSPIGKIQNKYRLQVLIRLLREKEDEIISKLFDLADEIKKPQVSIFVEIDPQNLS